MIGILLSYKERWMLKIFACAWICCAVYSVPAFATEAYNLSFPTSTHSEPARQHFLEGVAALHAFWYERALEEFQAASQADPTYAMAYWGEAMTYNHPIWRQHPDLIKARRALSKITPDMNVSEYESGYIAAARILYGKGDKAHRDQAYSDAMHAFYQKFPKSTESALFYALSILGALDPLSPQSLRKQMQAAAISLDIFAKEPNHPGASHYVIHSLDDPDHAILALPAAIYYAQSKPAAYHAIHMPSHIFLQLGMWSRTTQSNEEAWASSLKGRNGEATSPQHRDYHSLRWLLYSYLQEGRYTKAQETLKLIDDVTTHNPTRLMSMLTHALMHATWIIETENWQNSEIADIHDWMNTSFLDPIANHEGHCQTVSNKDRSALVFAHGLALAKMGQNPQKNLEILRKLQTETSRDNIYKHMLQIQELEIQAAVNVAHREFDSAIQMMKEATQIESQLPAPSGPPDLIKPTYEFSGEILLEANRPQESAAEFAHSLFRHPNRMRSLLGAARAARALKNSNEALHYYSKLLSQWNSSDELIPERQEAMDFVGSIKK